MDTTTVSNREFAHFVSEIGYVTEAERFGWSFVFYKHISSELTHSTAAVGTEWWRVVDGANWRDVNGPNTVDKHRHEDHPVVQVSWNDAYAKWAGGDYPQKWSGSTQQEVNFLMCVFHGEVKSPMRLRSNFAISGMAAFPTSTPLATEALVL